MVFSFPQYQTTERPDRAVQEILKGKVVILCDNSPEALILPGNFSSFMESSEDWYHRFEMASFLRILRYLAVIMATVLPGLLPGSDTFPYTDSAICTDTVFCGGEGRSALFQCGGTDFSGTGFELIREAGVRVPGSLGNAIGIVWRTGDRTGSGRGKSCESDRGDDRGVDCAWLYDCSK